MAIIKCKMCGGDMELSPDKSFGTCEYCGSTMTLPKVDDEQRAAAFNRGNHFRRLGEFDKALTVYERIVQEDERDAEAHWCCALCRFGIEYVKDPASGEYLPTCHRASFDSFLEDVDYRAALEYADAVARGQYEKDGEKIAQVQRGILSVSQKEKPFDVFLCYKESDENGDRTVDSTLAQDIYYQLTDRGYRVFFARITLEDKAGQAYEPYIFAALHSAKVMIVVGTRPEYLNAAWVKNEWSRYLSIVKKDRTKLLIPCYRDMDPYDMPEQLSVLQSYDMGKIGFVQDLIRGISKVISKDVPKTGHETELSGTNEGSGNLTALLKRGFMALEDGEWARADEFFEQALNQDAECGEAYFGKFLAEQKCSSLDSWENHIIETKLEQEQVHVCSEDKKILIQLAEQYYVPGYLSVAEIVGGMNHFDDAYLSIVSPIEKYISQVKELLSVQSDNKLLGRAFRYAKGNLAGRLTAAREQVLENLDQKLQSARQSDQQNEQRIKGEFETQKTQVLNFAKKLYKEALERKEADEKAEEERRRIAIEKQKIAEQAEERRKETTYQEAIKLQSSKKYRQAYLAFSHLQDYKDSQNRLKQCLRLYKRRNIIVDTMISIAIILIVGTVVVYQIVITPGMKYQKEGGDDNTNAILSELEEDQNEKEQSVVLWNRMALHSTLSAGNNHTIGLKTDGTVVATGDNGYGQCDVSAWTDIISVSAGYNHTVGLRTDGTVLATGDNQYNQCDVSGWTDIVAVSAGYGHTVGLKKDGTVIATGDNGYDQCDVSGWTDIVAVSAGYNHTVGLKVDGTVVAVGDHTLGQCNVSQWTNIMDVFAGQSYTIGLKNDGMVLATGWNYVGQCDVTEWTDVVEVATGSSYTIGIRTDGTVIATRGDLSIQCDVSKWKDIVAVSAGSSHAAGLRADGTVVATGADLFGRCNVSGWTDIRIPSKEVG